MMAHAAVIAEPQTGMQQLNTPDIDRDDLSGQRQLVNAYWTGIYGCFVVGLPACLSSSLDIDASWLQQLPTAHQTGSKCSAVGLLLAAFFITFCHLYSRTLLYYPLHADDRHRTVIDRYAQRNEEQSWK